MSEEAREARAGVATVPRAVWPLLEGWWYNTAGPAARLRGGLLVALIGDTYDLARRDTGFCGPRRPPLPAGQGNPFRFVRLRQPDGGFRCRPDGRHASSRPGR